MEKAIAATTIEVIKPESTMNGHEKRNDSVMDHTPAEAVPRSIASDQVRVVSIDEYKEAALCLAEAFESDHCARYFIDTPDRAHWTQKQKWDLHLSIMEYAVYAHCLKGLVTTVGPGYGAGALW